VHVPETGERGIEPGTLLLVGSIFLHRLTHLLICHLQEVLQAQLARGDFLGEGTEKDVSCPMGRNVTEQGLCPVLW
jgi:hypothetical protein